MQIISPPNVVSNLVCHLSKKNKTVICQFGENNEKLKSVIKPLGYYWHKEHVHWHLDSIGNIDDSLLSTAFVLHSVGFIIELDDDLLPKFQTGDWHLMSNRFVIVVDGKFGLKWRGENDNLYKKALTLPESHWDTVSKAITIPSLYFGEVAGFAEQHDFTFDDAATKLKTQAELDYPRLLIPSIEVATKRPTSIAMDNGQFYDYPVRSFTTITELYAHQVPAVEKLSKLTIGAFFMDMGTGKTRCAIELIARKQCRISHVVWLCPVSLKTTIMYEIKKHTSGQDVYVFDDKTSADNLPESFWNVVGIESVSSSDRVVCALHKLIDENTLVIVDESGYIKGHSSLRSMRIDELCKIARYRYIMTGTPISQGIEDLYAQMRFLSKSILGYQSFYAFARNHLEYSDKYKGMIVRSLNLGRIADKINPFVYQVSKDECMTLPPKLYDQRYCFLTSEQEKAYEQAKHFYLDDVVEEQLDSYVIFQLFTALQEIVSGYWNRGGTMIEYPHHRLDQLSATVDSIPSNEKVIVWCKFGYSVEQIKALYPTAAVYYGKLTTKQRDIELQKFREQSRILIATQATGGHGLTLNECRYHIFYENEFKYANRLQAEDRSHRLGQTKPVTYIDIVSDSGIDQKIQDALAKKENVVRNFRGIVKNKMKAMRL